MSTRQPSKTLMNYRFGEEYIARLNEDSALTSAHPDDCALFAGPPRLEMIPDIINNTAARENIFKLFGTFQSIQFSNAQTVVPIKSIGSSRYFYFTSNNPISFGFSTIMLKTDNLAKVIYTNLLAISGAPESIDAAFKDYIFNKVSDHMWFNIESELFSVPFGLGILWSNKERSFLGAAYIENALLVSYSTEITSGRQMLMESGSFIGDRIRPFAIEDIFNSNTEETNIFRDFSNSVKKYFGYE